MKSFLHRVIFILVLAIMEFATSTSNLEISNRFYDCAPAVRGNEYVFRGTVKHTLSEKLDLLWLKNKSPVSMCKSNMACYEYSGASTLTSIEHVAEGIYKYSLTIKNVTDLQEGVWSLKYLGLASLRRSEPLFSCTLNVYAMSALILHDCPDLVEEENVVRCWCGTNNVTEGDIDIAWFDAKGEEISNEEHLISYVAKRRNAGHQCRGWTSTGEKIMPLTYNPLIFAKAESVACTINFNKGEWNITCTVDKIYPQAICHFDIQAYDQNAESVINVEPDVKSIEYTHEYLDNEHLYFKSQCTLPFPSLPLLSNYTIFVNVHPNVSGSDSDLVYGVKRTISCNYVPLLERDETMDTSLTFSLIFIIVAVLLAVFLLLVVLRGVLRITMMKRNLREKTNADGFNKMDYTENNFYVLKRNLSETTLIHTENSEQDDKFAKECDNDLVLLGIKLKHGNSTEEKSTLINKLLEQNI